MRVLLSGATGVLGRRLIRSITANGHEVVGLARDQRGEKLVSDLGGTPTTASLFDPDALAARQTAVI